MVVLDVKVNCYSCLESVSKRNTRLFNLTGKGNVYQCYDCYKGNKSPASHSTKKQKNDFFCNHCRYKFSSRRAICPYCGSSENLVESNVAAVDLLG